MQQHGSLCDETIEEECNIAEETILQIEDSFLASKLPTEIIKFDTACSGNMSGIKGRITINSKLNEKIKIKGFNDSISYVDSIGVNNDGKREYFVSSMPSNLTLLCAYDYIRDGAAVLFPSNGVVLRMTEAESNSLQEYIKSFSCAKRLIVKNRTYEVDPSETCDEIAGLEDEANSSSASKYFNTKVNVSNAQESVLANLLTGLTFNDLYSMSKNQNVKGLNRELTIKNLNNFEHKFGRTPDVLQLAFPNLAGNKKGYMAPSEKLSSCGQRVEADLFESEFNEDILDSNQKYKKTQKLPTHGGATAGYIAVDAFSGYVTGHLIKNKDTNTILRLITDTVSTFKLNNHKIELFAADQGIISQSKNRIIMPEVESYLLSNGIKSQCGEAYNHNNGTAIAERVIRTIKELIRFAMLYILRNPNFPQFGFSKNHILKLWGELFYWAILIINLKPCPNEKTKTKFEIYHGFQPDLRNLRLFPIFSVLYVQRRTVNELNSKREFWQRGLYIGPSLNIVGAVRVAILSKNVVSVVVSSVIKAISDD
jgi:hypothetical protein